MQPSVLLQQVLFLFGIGFLVANLKVVYDLLVFRRRKQGALLIWEPPKPRYYGFSLALGVLLGMLLAFKVFFQRRPPDQLFGEAMMFVYYGYAIRLSARISHGFYEDGVWTDTGFMPWGKISAVSWREDGVAPILVLVSHHQRIAKHLVIPGPKYGEARRLLRDKVKAHDIHIGGTGLDLGSRPDEDSV